MKAIEKLRNKNNEGKLICVGLDTDKDKIPVHLKSSPDSVFEFNKEIIKNTSAGAAAYKINFAFYESIGVEGFKIIEKTLSLIPDDILVIADAKRGDIGNTAKMYAKSIYEHFGFDAVTLHAYMGEDSVKPFLEYDEKINFLLALTSNPGSEDFEKLKLDNGTFLFQRIIEKANSWNAKHNCGIVFGATKIGELRDNIDSFGNLAVLLPGVGAQGGSLEEVVKAFKKTERRDLLVNVSRSIIYSSNKEDFGESAGKELDKLNKIADALI